MHKVSLATLTASFLLVTVGPVHAADLSAKERAARKACLAGDYVKGIEILSDLFLDTKDVNHLYNQARCYEQSNRYEDAVGRFREYLRKATNISRADRIETEEHIESCLRLLGKGKETEAQAPVVAPSPPQDATPSPASPPPPPEEAKLVEEPAPSVASSEANPGSGLRVAGIACAAGGLASVGTAIYFYTRARSYSDKVSGQDLPVASDEDAGRRAETMQWVFYGVGAAALTTGTVLYVLGRSAAGKTEQSVGFAPLVGPGLAGLSARGAF